jgi:predicted ester cyclase
MTMLERWFDEVWDKGSEAAIDELLAPDAVIHNLMNGNGEGTFDAAALKAMLRSFLPELSQVHVELDHQIVDREFLAAHCVVTAIHKGYWPRSTPIHFTGMVMVRVRDCRIAESWNYFDFETMYRQME